MTFFDVAGLFLATHLPIAIVLLLLAAAAGIVAISYRPDRSNVIRLRPRRRLFHWKRKTGCDL